MCLVLFAWQVHPRYPLILAGNRDEFHARPAAPAEFWEEAPEVLAGRDLQAGGTWLGIARNGRFAAITNFRDPANHNATARSRGALVRDFLLGSQPASAYLAEVLFRAREYNGFNLLAGDRNALYCLESVTGQIRRVSPGIHGLSNHLLDTPWPKVAQGRRSLATIIEADGPPDTGALLNLLASRDEAEDWALPDTGVGLALERRLSAAFICDPRYGTRCSTVVIRDAGGGVDFTERQFSPDGAAESIQRLGWEGGTSG